VVPPVHRSPPASGLDRCVVALSRFGCEGNGGGRGGSETVRCLIHRWTPGGKFGFVRNHMHTGEGSSVPNEGGKVTRDGYRSSVFVSSEKVLRTYDFYCIGSFTLGYLRSCRSLLVGTFGECGQQAQGIHKNTQSDPHSVPGRGPTGTAFPRLLIVAGSPHETMRRPRLCSERGSARLSLPCVTRQSLHRSTRLKTWKFSGPPVANLGCRVTNEMDLVRTIYRCWSAHPAGHSTESWLWLPSETPQPVTGAA